MVSFGFHLPNYVVLNSEHLTCDLPPRPLSMNCIPMPHDVPSHRKKITRQKRNRRIDKFMVSFALFYLQSISLYVNAPDLRSTSPPLLYELQSPYALTPCLPMGAIEEEKIEAGQLTSPMVSFGHFCLPNYFIVT